MIEVPTNWVDWEWPPNAIQSSLSLAVVSES